jgi:hypothetical protein
MSENERTQEILDGIVDDAEDALYSFLDRNGATKKAAYAISRLIDVKVAAALNKLVDDYGLQPIQPLKGE